MGITELVLIVACLLVGFGMGRKWGQTTLASKARQLHDDVQTAYSREAVLWHHGYKRALMDMFDESQS